MAKKVATPLAIRQVALDSLVPYKANARTHSEGQVRQIAESIREYGFTNPVLIDSEMGVLAGHGRVLAARTLGLATVPCIELAHLSPAQRRAYILADNKLALNAGWDEALLAIELGELNDDGYDLALTGFDEDELERLLALAGASAGNCDPDDTPEPEAEPVSVLGDVWLLGRHRITCGDATSADDVSRVLAGVEPHLMVTDPPYGVAYDPSWRADAGVNKNKRKLGKVLYDDRADWREAWALFPGDVAYVWHAGLFAGAVAESLTACGFKCRSQIIWAKDRFALSRSDYHWQHEPCWYAIRDGKKAHTNGDRTQSTLWSIKAREDSGNGHGTQKPVECMRRPIENNSSPGQAVYEPFSGSGTTIIAAEMTGRSCLAIELNPIYVDVAVRRWQEFTGDVATLEGDGRTFDAISAQRLPAKAA